MIALVAAGTLNSSAANFKTAVKGVDSGTLSLKTIKFLPEPTEFQIPSELVKLSQVMVPAFADEMTK